MKKIICLLFLVNLVSLYSQDEFFKNQTGITPFYQKLKGYELSGTEAIGLGAYFKGGLCIQIAEENLISEKIFVGSIGYRLTDYNELNTMPFKPYTGISFAKINDVTFVNFDFILTKCFLMNTIFPFSINGSTSLQTYFSTSDSGGSDFLCILGVGYNQAFFTNSIIYPVVGVAAAYDVNYGINFQTFSIGINIKLSKNKAVEKSEQVS